MLSPRVQCDEAQPTCRNCSKPAAVCQYPRLPGSKLDNGSNGTSPTMSDNQHAWTPSSTTSSSLALVMKDITNLVMTNLNPNSSIGTRLDGSFTATRGEVSLQGNKPGDEGNNITTQSHDVVQLKHTYKIHKSVNKMKGLSRSHSNTSQITRKDG